MFIIRCTHCGREVEWKDGEEVGKLMIECVGSTVICACGHGIGEDGGAVLKEFKVPDSE